MTKPEREMIRQDAWNTTFEENMEWAQQAAEFGHIKAALVVADVAFHQLRIKAIQREKEQQCGEMPLPVL